MRLTLLESLPVAFRALRARPAFALAIVATLALCSGAVVAALSVLGASLLRPLPFPDPGALYQVGVAFERGEQRGLTTRLEGAEWTLLRDTAPALSLAAFSDSETELNLSGDAGAAYVTQRRVGAGYFGVFGLPLAAGREFSADEDRVGAPRVAILGHAFWRRAFGGRADLLGQPIRLAGESYTVVGIAPAAWPQGTDVWTPLQPTVDGEGRGRNYAVVARIAPGIAPEAAQQTLAAVAAALPGAADAQAWRRSFVLRDYKSQVDAPLREPLGLAVAMVALLLLIGIANAAGMLLARASERLPELATRVAIGAGRRHLVGQALAEGLLLAWLGALAGVGVGALLLVAMKALLPPAFAALSEATIDLRVVLAMLAIATATGIAAAALPAWRAARVDWQAVRSGTRATDRAGARSRGVLVTAQLGITVAALVAAGLLYRGFDHLARLEPGFDAEGVLTASFAMRDARYTDPQRAVAYYDAVRARLAALPGVQAAAVALSLPYETALNDAFAVDGGGEGVANLNYVTPGYFEAFAIPLLQGRRPSAADRADTEPVVVVNAAFARRWFADAPALDRRVVVGGRSRRVVGVVGDTLERSNWGDFGLLDHPPAVYVPAAQVGAAMTLFHTWFSPSFVVRADGDADALRAAVERAVAEVDAALPVARFRTPDDLRRGALAVPRFMASLLATLGAFAIVLAALGVHGLLRQVVAARTREFGVRLALGATPAGLARVALAPALRALAIGGALGALAAVAGARALGTLLHGVPAHDPLALGFAAAAVTLAVALAATLPARRVARLDAVVALRSD